MLSFFRFIWNLFWRTLSAVRNLFFNLLFVLIVLVVIASVVKEPGVSVPESTALYVAPKGMLVDQTTYTPGASDLLMENNSRIAETPLRDLVNTIQKAAKDSRITAMVLRLDGFAGGGISKMEELGQALEAFKEAGKPIYAYADQYSQQQYFLASYADTIYMNEMGNILLTGFGTFRNYFQEAADKISVKFHVFRVGDYKDAVEPFMRNSMSAASREHNSRWLNELWQEYVTRVTSNRDLPTSRIASYIHDLARDPAIQTESLSELALQAGLVDELLTRDGINKKLAEKVGKEEDSDDYKAISYQDYARATKSTTGHKGKNKIGLIVASGNIFDGTREKGSIGGDSLSALIKQARKDDSLKALVIRVDSGGGSAFASEIIRQEIQTTRDADIPVYISMGSVAASGGYWISTAAEEIWATPTTITGSIGVFGLIPNVEQSLKRIGVHSDGVGTTDLSGIYHVDREMSEPAKNLIQSGVNDIYARFLNLVAESRGSDPASVNEIAGGRVWTGSMAKTLGLVDQLGGLNQLLDSIAANKGLGDYQVKLIEKPLTATQELMKALAEEVSVDLRSQILARSDTLRAAEMTMAATGQNHLFKQLEPVLSLNPNQLNEGHPANVMAVCMDCYSP